MPKPKELQKFTSSYAKDFTDNAPIYGKGKKVSVTKSFGLKDFRAILQKTTAVSLDSVPRKKSKVKKKIKALSTHTHGEKIKYENKNVPKKKLLPHPRDDFNGTSKKKDIATFIKEKRKDNKLPKERLLGNTTPRRESPVHKLSRHQSPILRVSRRQSPMPRVSRQKTPTQTASRRKDGVKQQLGNILHTPSEESYTVESSEGRKSIGDKPIYCSKDKDLEELNSVIKTLDNAYNQKATPETSEFKMEKPLVNVSLSDQYVVQAANTEKQSLDAKTLRALINSSGSVDIDDSMVVKLLEESLILAIKKGDIALSDVKGGFSSATSSDTGSLKKLHYEEVVHSYSDTGKTFKKVVKGKKNIERPATVASTPQDTNSQKNITSILCPSIKKSGYRQLNDMLNPNLEIEEYFEKVQAYVKTFPGWLQIKAKKKIFNLVIELDVYRKKYGRKI